MRVDSNSQDKHSHTLNTVQGCLDTSFQFQFQHSAQHSSRQKYQHAPKILGLALMLAFYYHL